MRQLIAGRTVAFASLHELPEEAARAPGKRSCNFGH